MLFLAPSFLSEGGYVYWQGHVTPGALMKLLNTTFGKPVERTSMFAIKVTGAALLTGVVVSTLGYALRRARSERGRRLGVPRRASCSATR